MFCSVSLSITIFFFFFFDEAVIFHEFYNYFICQVGYEGVSICAVFLFYFVLAKSVVAK